jgi:(5-formylfuran-3-yl)methyl phosphate synthase
MTRLLLSVRSADEAEIACTAGADLIDVKEPDRGPLGAADGSVITDVTRRVAERVPISVALGELVDGVTLDPQLGRRVQYAKFGLAGAARLDDWVACWQAAINALPPAVTPVAVAYGDWQSAAAPDPWEVLAQGVQLGCGALLLDTFDKSGGPLNEHLAADELRRLIAAAGESGLLSVVSGGLGMAEVELIARLTPDYIGVRGAACAGDRTAKLDLDKSRKLVELVHSSGDVPRATNHVPRVTSRA